ncbi:MAG: response regulator [Fibrobacterota bacterium]
MPKILIVDDDIVFLDVLRRALERDGHCIRTVSESSRVFAYLQNETWDLLILDMVMPAPDGVDVLRQVRRQSEGLPIIAVSGGGRITEGVYFLEYAQAMGVAAVFDKPIHDFAGFRRVVAEKAAQFRRTEPKFEKDGFRRNSD